MSYDASDYDILQALNIDRPPITVTTAATRVLSREIRELARNIAERLPELERQGLVKRSSETGDFDEWVCTRDGAQWCLDQRSQRNKG